jgi:hypothetical protein
MSQPNPGPSLARLAARQASHAALVSTISVVVWAVSTDASGYFWPGWVMVVALLAFVTRVGRAALGDAEEIHKLEMRYGGAR